MNGDLSGLSVLIVDDEEDFAHTLSSRLQLRGMSVNVACSGDEGMRFLAHTLPDVLLLDMRMPGLSGTDVLKKLRQEKTVPGGETLPVIIVSGHSSVQDYHVAQDLGIQGYVAKPLQFDELLAAIASATGRA